MPRTEMVGAGAERNAQQSAGQNRNGDEGEFLRDVEGQILGDVDHERAESDPHHETEIEIEESGDECRKMSGFLEVREIHSFPRTNNGRNLLVASKAALFTVKTKRLIL